MSLEAATAAPIFAEVLADTPDVLSELNAAHDAAVEALDPRLYDLARMRIAMLLGADDELASTVLSEAEATNLAQWPSAAEFNDQDRAVLAFVEQWVIDVATLDDVLANNVVEHLGGDGFATFIHALLVIEQRQRLRLAWARLFEGPS